MRVLIAEDDPSTRHLLRRLFSEWGHSVQSASDADEAWTIVAGEQPPHIVILDHGLTKGGGLGLCRLMCDLPTRARMHVLLSMAVIDSNAMIAAFEAGADDLVEKPFDMAELRLRVASGCAEVRVRLSELRIEEPAALPSPAPLTASHRAIVAQTTIPQPADTRPLVIEKAPPYERQHAVMASLSKLALSGLCLRDFSAQAVHQIADVLSACQVQILERKPDRVSLLVRASVGQAVFASGESPLPPERGRCVGHLSQIEIGPGRNPYGALHVEVEPVRRLQPFEIEFATGIAHLVGLVAERERLEAQVQQAQKMEIFGRLAGGIAHDFNNVLAVIGTGVSGLETRIADDRELREDVELVAQGVERGRLLARRLLRFSRAPSDAPALIDLNQIVSDGQAMMERILVGQVTVTTAMAPAPLVVRADRGEVEQILLNLVLNARDAMPSGGVIRITTAAAQPKNAGPQVSYAAFSVVDTGVGMDPSTKARMFEPFFTTKPPSHGTGLGLSTVKEIVRRAEGCVEVESQPGQGTSITVFWPCAAEAARGGDVAAPAQTRARNNQSAA